MGIRFRYFLFLAFVTVFVNNLWGAEQFRKLSTPDGLSNRRVLAMAKDSKGYFWFATRLAIDRYDGDKFLSYPVAEGEKVRGVISDREGRVFAFTEKSVYQFREDRDSFLIVVKSKDVCKKNAASTINTIYFDGRNRLWMALASGLYHSQNMTSWILCHELGNYPVYSFADGGDDGFWVGRSNGVAQIKLGANKEFFVSYPPGVKAVNHFRIQSLYYDKITRKLWIGTFSDGLFTYSSGAAGVQRTIPGPTTPPVRAITGVSDTDIWVGYDGWGIFVYNRFDNSLVKTYTQNNEASLESNGIYHIFKDRASTWVCTYTGGIFVYDRTKPNFRLLAPTGSGGGSFADSHINAVLEDSEGEIWFGTNNGINIYNPLRKTWRNILQNRGKEGSRVILSLYEDRNQNVWVGGFATDLIRINKRTGAVKKILIPSSEAYHITQNYIYSILEDRDGMVWLGGVISDFIRYNPKTDNFTKYNIKGINKIVELNGNTLILGTVNGLFLFDKRNGNHRKLNLRKLSNNSAVPSYPFINNIVRDPKNPSVVWIGSDGNGLLNYNISTQEVQHFTTSYGLSSNYVYGILFDKFNRLWVSTENGLNCLTLGGEHSIFRLHGLPESTFNFLAYYKLRSGEMVWGTPRGGVEIDPEDILEQETCPFNLRFNGLYVYYDKQVTGKPGSGLTEGIDDTRSVLLSYSQRSFSFDFFNVGFPAKKHILYSWKLKGFDNGWSTPTSDHKAVYTNIPWGRYTFMVKAINTSNGKESDVRTIEVEVMPPFWATPIAYLIYVILLLGTISLLAKLYRNRVESQNSEEKINFFVNMAHDIRIPITLIKAPLNEIEQESLTESGQSALKLAQRNTQKLFNMVNQLLDFQKVGLSAINLHVEETHINHFINELLYNFMLPAKEKGIEIDFIPLSNNPLLWIDRQKVNLILENLLSNAIKYSGNGGSIRVVLQLNSGVLLLEVADSGIGIPAKAQGQIFNRFFRAPNTINSNEVGSGIGLLLTKKLVLLHKGKISFVSQEHCGTTFRVELPVVRSSYSTEEIIENESIHEAVGGEEDEADNKLKVLFVEDNDELRSYLSRLLCKEYRVEEATNGEEALELIKAESPDFVISDIIMPKLSGIELCAKLKNNVETCHIPVVLLTSLSDRDDVIRGLNAGADDYITKPFDLPILLNKIKTILNNRALFRRKYMDKLELIESDSQLNNLDKQFMKRVIQTIEDNISNEEFSVETLASELAMSRSVFFKKLKALTDQSPADLVRDIRMKRAADLLREQRYSVNEIAYLTGFPNPKYFSTAFKKYYGSTPTIFLEKEKGGRK